MDAGKLPADAMLLSYAWQNDFCFPGQRKLGVDMGLHETNVRKHLKALETNGLLVITRRGQGRTKYHELYLKPKRSKLHLERAKTLGLDQAN